MKYKPKSRVKKNIKGQENNVHRNPSLWEYVKGSLGSQPTKRSCLKPTEGQPSSMPISLRDLYLSQFLDFPHVKVDDMVDIGDNKNCGFRVIAAILGWGEDSWSLGRMLLDTQVHQHPQLYFKLFITQSLRLEMPCE